MAVVSAVGPTVSSWPAIPFRLAGLWASHRASAAALARLGMAELATVGKELVEVPAHAASMNVNPKRATRGRFMSGSPFRETVRPRPVGTALGSPRGPLRHRFRICQLSPRENDGPHPEALGRGSPMR